MKLQCGVSVPPTSCSKKGNRITWITCYYSFFPPMFPQVTGSAGERALERHNGQESKNVEPRWVVFLLSLHRTAAGERLVSLGPLSPAAYNYHLKPCPNCYISRDFAIVLRAAPSRLQRSLLHKFARRSAFCPPTMGCQARVNARTHARTHPQACSLALFPPHTEEHFVFRQTSTCYVPSEFGQCFIRGGHAIISH